MTSDQCAGARCGEDGARREPGKGRGRDWSHVDGILVGRQVSPSGRRETPPMKDLNGRTAVVTGSASGIGLSIATALLAEDMNVVMADRDGARLEREAAALAPGRVQAVVCDVSDPDALLRLAETTIERFGAVHVLCNNAGIIRPGSTW